MRRTVAQLQAELRKHANKTRAKFVAGYFKTGPGEYGEGDVFLGVTVPAQRTVATRYITLSQKEVQELLESPIHEFRLTALLILVAQYKKGDVKARQKIASFYLKHRRHINNWDLVDTSAPYILGDYLLKKDKAVIYQLARSRNVWERRIAMLTTYGFIKEGRFKDTLALAERMLNDTHDLIHKAAGWMLREVGNRDRAAATAFLEKHAHHMPRTMLRYAVEKLDPKVRVKYLRAIRAPVGKK